MSELSRKRVLIIQAVLGTGFLIAWLMLTDVASVVKILSQVRWGYLVAALALAASSTLIRSIRWTAVLEPVARISWTEIWLVVLASSLVNFVIPLRTGEIARSLFLKQRHQVPVSVSLPTVAVDRSLDLLALVVIGAIGAISGLALDASLSALLIIGGLLFLGFAVIVGLAIVASERFLALVRRAIPRAVGEAVRNMLLRLVEGTLAGFATLGKRPRSLLPKVALSFVAVLLDASLLFVILLSVGSSVSPMMVVVGYALFALTFLIPSAPGYIGSMEAFGSVVLVGLGVGEVQAAGAIVIFHALTAALLGISGASAMWVLGLRPRSAFRSIMRMEPAIEANSVSSSHS